MKIEVFGQFEGDIQNHVESKLAFLEPRLKEGTIVSFYVKKKKGGDLNRVKVVVPYINNTIVVESDNHRSLMKCIDEVKDRLKEVMSRQSNRVKDRKGNLSFGEVLANMVVGDDECDVEEFEIDDYSVLSI